MKNKNFFAKALAFALVAGTVGTHGTLVNPVNVVQAAATAPTISPDYDTFTAEITSGKPDGSNAVQDSYVCLQVLKDASGSKVNGEYWYAVDSSSHKVTVDLSFLKSTKAQYIRACGMDGTLSTVTTIPAQPKTVVKYNAKTGKFVDKSKAEITADNLKKYEYKSLYGSEWVVSDSSTNGLADFDLTTATVAGTTIVVRSVADTTSGNEKLVGTEVKVKVSAAAKAPKVKIDYAKGTITLPKNAEAKIVGGTSSDYVKLSGKFTPMQLLEGLKETTATAATKAGTGFSLIVRTAKTGNKPASNIAVLPVNATPVLTATAETFSIGNSATTVKITENLSGATLDLAKGSDATKIKLTATTPSGKVDATFRYSTDDGKTWANITSAASATNVETDYSATIIVTVLPVGGTFAPNELEISCTK